jgi:hypothetical protein
MSSLPRVSALLSSHSTLTASRPCTAAKVFSASTATPAGTATTSTTPLIALAAAASNDFTVAPNRSGRLISAVSRPGRLTSRAKTVRPVVLSAESTRGTRVPMRVHSFGSLRRTLAGTGRRAAASASSPKRAERPDAVCVTTPLATAMAAGGTPQRSAAASTSICRMAAPALRNCSQELATEVEPPVPWIWPKARLL